MSEISCKECGKCFKNKYTLKTHSKIHQQRERNFKCQEKNCEKYFLTKNHLENHLTTVHECLERKFICNICKKSFKTLNNLQTHEAVHSERSFLCRFCDKTFTRSQDVKVHENIHKDEKSFKCKQCDKEFKQQSNLIEHVKIVKFMN
jgi:uncharacterized Zn-finger protein